MVQTISGVIDKIQFFNEDNGWTVAVVIPEGDHDQIEFYGGTIKVVGVFPKFSEGESAQFTGVWESNQRYGRQFKASGAVPRVPKTKNDIIQFLSGAQVKSIGPDSAKSIVAQFGEATIDILDEEPWRLFRIRELKPEQARRLMLEWEKNHIQRHTLVFLQQELGLSASLARRIYSHYGKETRRNIKSDPYNLALDEFVSFDKADEIAKKFGALDGHVGRLKAGLVQAMNDFRREGHTFAPRPGALARAANLLRMEDQGALEGALDNLLNDEKLGEEEFDNDSGAKPTRAIYLPRYWHAENAVAGKLRGMAIRSSSLIHTYRNTNWARFLHELSQANNLSLSTEQKNAVRAALTSKISVLTGGPGTGKTTTLQLLISVLRLTDFRFHLAAPTGRAARRLADATKCNASTIHRLLNWDPKNGRFAFHDGNPLLTDIVVVDEASMIDLRLFRSLLDAMPVSAHLLLVGDVDQLPSVGAGNVLSDVIESEGANVTRLEQVFRQDDVSHIASNAKLINMGNMPIIDNNNSSDFFFSSIQDPGRAAEMIVDIVAERVPKKFGFNPVRDIQVMAPMKRGVLGVNELNRRLQQALNGSSRQEARFKNMVLRVGDKVMQTRNDYDKEVFNGDIGFIKNISVEDKTLDVRFDYGGLAAPKSEKNEAPAPGTLDDFLALPADSDLITYDFGEIDNLMLAYCITVHKSQGSEFPVVVLPIHLQQSKMLQRNLLYTAVTRAKRLVVLVGTRDAIEQAVVNNRTDERHSGLLHRLRA